MSARILRDDGAVPRMSDCDGGSESALPGSGEEVPGGGGLQEGREEEGAGGGSGLRKGEEDEVPRGIGLQELGSVGQQETPGAGLQEVRIQMVQERNK